jgi:hypothetical protein
MSRRSLSVLGLLVGCDPTPEPSSIEVEWAQFEPHEDPTIRTLGVPVPGPELRMTGGLVPRPRMVCGGVPPAGGPKTPCRGKERYAHWKPTCSVAPDAPSEDAVTIGDPPLLAGVPGGLVVNEDYTLTATQPGSYTVTCTVPDTDASAEYTVTVDVLTDELVIEADPLDTHDTEAFWVGERIQTRWPLDQTEPVLRVGRVSRRGERVDLTTAELLTATYESSAPGVMYVVPDRLTLEARSPGVATITVRLGESSARTDVRVVEAPRLLLTAPARPPKVGDTCQVTMLDASDDGEERPACQLRLQWERGGQRFDLDMMDRYAVTVASTRPDILDDSFGTLTARSPGAVTVAVHVEGARATLPLTVTP